MKAVLEGRRGLQQILVCPFVPKSLHFGLESLAFFVVRVCELVKKSVVNQFVQNKYLAELLPTDNIRADLDDPICHPSGIEHFYNC